ncbi:hypothetical protein EG68_03263 [Paragonimus skrjabini miyazakii]|uniref:Fibronectin type-III domain-containing protein n=1 Tax=Paragonimus skrjabini miyazakii TaxID=59628 RepID=A0A8S9YB72_9TREM|nr:hypothetical protein EG68_03263 [Paragonimus skrjabini miyazakii]
MNSQFLVFTLLTFSICRCQRIGWRYTPPDKPIIQDVRNEAKGILVRWEVQSFQPIIFHRIRYKDSHGRSLTMRFPNGQPREALLFLVRPCEQYEITVESENAFGVSQPSDSAVITRTAIDKPSPPASVELLPHAEGHVVHWQAPVNSSQFSKYVIIGREDHGEIVEQSVSYDQLEAVLTEFHHFHAYNLSIVTENSCGRSEESNVVRVEQLPVPGQPLIQRVVPEDHSITLYFSPNPEGGRLDYYKFSYSTKIGDIRFRTVDAKPSNITFVNHIEQCFNHTFKVVGVNPTGDSDPAIRTARTLSKDVPSTPTDLRHTKTPQDRYQLNWTVHSSRPVINQRVDYINQDGQTYLEWVKGEVTNVVLQHVKQCYNYSITVQSENDCGWSPKSDQYTLALPPIGNPTQPKIIQASGNITSVQLNWVASPDEEQRKQYDILVIGHQEGVENYWAPPNSTLFMLTGFNSSSIYTISLRTENICGWSELEVFKLKFDTLVTLPAPVITGVEYRKGAVVIKWKIDYGGDNLVRHVIHYTDGRRDQHIIANPSEREKILPFVRPCTYYTAKIMSATTTVNSPYSEPYQFKGYQLDRPPAPEGIHVKNHPNGRLLRWNPVPDVYQVLVYTIIGRGGNHEELRQEVFEEVTEVLLDAFHFEHNYNVTMTATSYCGTSPESEPVFVPDIPNLEPPSVTVINRTDVIISIRIEPSNRGARVDSYRVQYTVPNAPDEILDIYNISQPIILKTGLKECFNHTISVYARNPADESEPTVINVMLLSKNVPQQPVLIDVITIGQKTMVQWSTNSSTQLVAHKIEYTDNVNKYVDWAIGDANEIWLNNMKGCRTFTIHVSSENTCGWSEHSQPMNYEVPPIIPAGMPSHLNVTGTAGELLLQWNKANSTEHLIDYDILLADNQGNVRSYWAAGSMNFIVVRNLEPNTVNHMALSARNDCGWSDGKAIQVAIDSAGEIIRQPLRTSRGYSF